MAPDPLPDAAAARTAGRILERARRGISVLSARAMRPPGFTQLALGHLEWIAWTVQSSVEDRLVFYAGGMAQRTSQATLKNLEILNERVSPRMGRTFLTDRFVSPSDASSLLSACVTRRHSARCEAHHIRSVCPLLGSTLVRRSPRRANSLPLVSSAGVGRGPTVQSPLSLASLTLDSPKPDGVICG